MSKGLTRSLARASGITAPIIKQTIACRGLALTVDGASGVGWGTVVAGDFPDGNIMFLGAVANLSFAGAGSQAGLVDTWAGDFGIGTTPASDATITGSDVNLLPSTALAAATAEVSPITRVQSIDAANAVIYDNTAGGLEINVSLLVDDADISADSIAFTVEGEIYLSYVMLGDD